MLGLEGVLVRRAPRRRHCEPAVGLLRCCVPLQRGARPPHPQGNRGRKTPVGPSVFFEWPRVRVGGFGGQATHDRDWHANADGLCFMRLMACLALRKKAGDAEARGQRTEADRGQRTRRACTPERERLRQREIPGGSRRRASGQIPDGICRPQGHGRLRRR